MKLDATAAARIRAQIALYPDAAAIAADVIAEAERIHDQPLLEVEREPGRDVILPTSRNLFNRVTTLGIAAAIDGRNKHRARAVRELLTAAAFESWNPGHFLDTAEMVAAMALGFGWFRPVMSGREAEAIATAIIDKGLRPGAAQMEAGAFWVNANTNWNIVCCGGLIVGSLAVQDRNAALCHRVLWQARSAIANGLDAFDADGGYPEGPGYWEYSLKYAVLAIEALRQAGHEEAPSPSLLKSWRYGMAMTSRSGAAFDIGDTVERPDRSPMLGWLALESGDPQAAAWQHRSPGRRSAFDLLWFAPSGGAELQYGMAVFKGAGVSVLAKPDDSMRMLLKGGRNRDNHAHLDLGSILLDIDGVRFVEDIGREDYSVPGYFDPARRFTYLRTKTSAHSALFAVGTEQSIEATASLLGSREADGQCAAAYAVEDPQSPIDHRRAVALGRSGQAFVLDDIAPKTAAGIVSVQWQIVTRAAVIVEGDVVRLSCGKIDVLIEIIEPRQGCWHAETMPSPQGESDNSDFTRVCLSLDLRERQTIAVRFRLSTVGPEDAPSILDGWTQWRGADEQP